MKLFFFGKIKQLPTMKVEEKMFQSSVQAARNNICPGGESTGVDMTRISLSQSAKFLTVQ